MIIPVIWRGWGILILVVAAACMIATQLSVNVVMWDARFYQTHTWPKVLGLWIAAAVNWLFGRWLNRGAEIDLTDSETTESGSSRSILRYSVLVWPEVVRELRLTEPQQTQANRLLEAAGRHLRRLDPEAQWDETQQEKVSRLRDELFNELARRVRQLLTPEQHEQWEDFVNGRLVLRMPGKGHWLFFIPVQYWWIVFLVLGAIVAFR
jgi:hypothetical protein